MLLIVFGMLFGARHLTPRGRHDGLVLAIAVESVVKLVALLALAALAIWGVFGGFGGLDDWLARHPEALTRMATPAREGPWFALLLLSFAAAFLLPRQWHMAFTENAGEQGLRTASWAFPLYLILLTAALPPILWAGQAVGLTGNPDLHVLGLARSTGSPTLTALVFLGGLSAASAMILVTTIALAGMCLNHLVLPLAGLGRGPAFYRRLLWLRRALIAAIILAGYGFNLALGRHHGLADLGLVSFVAVVQFLPGLLGVLFWRRATAAGFLAGLSSGIVLWGLALLAPLVWPQSGVDLLRWLGIEGDPWTAATALSLGLNALIFTAVSLARPQRAVEAEAAAACRSESLTAAPGAVSATSPQEFAARLAPMLGAETAQRELARALADLRIDTDERRPAELRRLRDRIERNLSGLIGPVLARAAVDEGLSLEPQVRVVVSDQIRFLEETVAARLAGPALELEEARRYLRRILEDLPLGVCTLGPSGEVVLWNAALAHLTGISPSDAVGHPLGSLPCPWGETLARFAAGEALREELRIGAPGQERAVALGRSVLDAAALRGGTPGEAAGLILLCEDRTEQRALEARVAHQDRLASIGQLAAGVAHEIGNPLTGIASAAQNLREEAGNDDVRERLGLILDSTGRIDRILQALRGFAHRGGPLSGTERRAPVRLAEIAAEAATLARLSRSGRSLEFALEVPPDLTVHGDRQRLEQVLVNLLTNASDASPPGGTIRVTARRRGEKVEVTVADRGSGIPASARERVFEPFFTTKEPGEGTGLGLSVVYNIVTEHGGTVDIVSDPGTGTTVTVTLAAASRD